MASFTTAGDKTALSLNARGDQAAIALSGTYLMTIDLQREQGSPGSGSWETLKTWDTENATVAYTHTATHDRESLRLFLRTDGGGTCTATITDALDLTVFEQKDSNGRTMFKITQAGVVFYDQNGKVLWSTGGAVKIADAATYTVLAANTGKVHILPNLTNDIVITLPSPVSGLSYEFIYGGVAADAQDWAFDTKSNTNYFLGGLVHLDTDADAAGDEVVMIAGDGNSNSKLSILTPQPGTRVRLTCDGTNWFIDGYVASVTVPAFADQ